VSNIKRDICTDLFFDTLILILIVYFGRDTNCGIPIYTWNLVYFILLALRSLANFAKIYVVRNFYAHSNAYSILSFVIIDGCFLGWIIYGNFIFYSSENRCNDIEETQMLYNLMLVLIIIGYFQFLVYGLILCFLPCILYYLIHQQQAGPRPTLS
jgi:hypothetical protein